MTSVRLRVREAAAYLRETHGLKVAAASLNKRRCVGGGPAFRRLGRNIFYDRVSLDRWAHEALSPELRSTSDGRQKAA